MVLAAPHSRSKVCVCVLLHGCVLSLNFRLHGLLRDNARLMPAGYSAAHISGASANSDLSRKPLLQLKAAS